MVRKSPKCFTSQLLDQFLYEGDGAGRGFPIRGICMDLDVLCQWCAQEAAKAERKVNIIHFFVIFLFYSFFFFYSRSKF